MGRIIRILLVAGAVFGGGLLFFIRRKTGANYPVAETFLLDPIVDATVTRSDDDTLTIHWQAEADRVTVYVGTSPDDIDHSTPLATVDASQTVNVPDRDPTVRYYFDLVFEGGAADGERVRVAERNLPLEGAVNFRDLGGYRTANGGQIRWGRFYRSGELSRLTPKDQQYLADIGLKFVCDLRTTGEVTTKPDKLPANGVRSEHIVVREDPAAGHALLVFNLHRLDEVMLEAYTKLIIDERATTLGKIIRRIADPANHPIDIHCTAGKDRAGIVAALVLLYLGVPEEVVLADYAQSNIYYETFYRTAEEQLKPLRWLGLTADDLRPVLVADADLLRRTLAHVRETYGSVEGYLRGAAGLDDETLASLREHLVRN